MSLTGILGILLVILAIAFHELGHAIAMIRHRLPIAKITLLGMGPTLFTFRLPFIKRFRGIPFRIALLPLGASVAMTEAGSRKMEGLPFPAKCHVYANGIMANLLYAAILLFIAALIDGNLSVPYLGILAGVAAIAYFSRYTFWLIYPLGIAFLVILLRTALNDFETFAGQAGSFVSIGHLVYTESIDISLALRTAAAVSFSIGIFNTLPISPLDGGKMMADLIGLPFSPHTRNVISGLYFLTVIPLIILAYLALKNDLLLLLK